MFTYGKLCNVDYEDSESPNPLLDFESSAGIRWVLVDEGNLVVECCSLKFLRKDIQMKKNLSVSLRPFPIGELVRKV